MHIMHVQQKMQESNKVNNVVIC